MRIKDQGDSLEPKKVWACVLVPIQCPLRDNGSVVEGNCVVIGQEWGYAFCQAFTAKVAALRTPMSVWGVSAKPRGPQSSYLEGMGSQGQCAWITVAPWDAGRGAVLCLCQM